MIEKELARYFTGLSDYWRSIYIDKPKPWDFFHHHAVIKRKDAVINFVAHVTNGTKQKILDAGCGTGMIMAELLEQGHMVFGLELSDAMAKEAHRNLSSRGFDDVDIRIGSIQSSGYGNGIFDTTLCIGVLQYLDTDEKALRELTRITKTNGHIILSLPNIFRVTTLTDPYYYIRRAPFFLFTKTNGKKKMESTKTTHRHLPRKKLDYHSR